MSASAIIAVRRSIRAALLADAGFVHLLGGPFIYDGAPRNAVPPYLTFGDASLQDWSTQTDRGAEQTLTLDVWSQQPGARQVLALAAEAERVLREAALSLDDHRLVSLACRALATRRDDDGRLQKATLTFRAVTEAI